MSTHRRDPKAIRWTRRTRRRLAWDVRTYLLVLLCAPAFVIGGFKQLLASDTAAGWVGGFAAVGGGLLVLVIAALYVRRPPGVGE